MFRLYSISVVDSRTTRLKYLRFKFTIPLFFDNFYEVSELRKKIKETYNPQDISVYEYIRYAIENKPYTIHQCEPYDISCNLMSDIFMI